MKRVYLTADYKRGIRDSANAVINYPLPHSPENQLAHDIAAVILALIKPKQRERILKGGKHG